MSRHLALPVRYAAGRLATVAAGSLDDVRQSVGMLLDTRRGERLSIPDYGIPDPTFTGVDVATIDAAVAQHERRARIQIDTDTDVDGTAQVQVTVSVADPGADL